jgi:hypothetical protein
MYKHVDDIDSHLWEVIDLNSGNKIERCLWADEESGEYCVYVVDEKTGTYIEKILIGNIQLKRKEK